MATKSKLTKVAKPFKQNAKVNNTTRLDESRTSVSVADALQPSSSKQSVVVEISSDSESNYDDLSGLDDDVKGEEHTPEEISKGNNNVDTETNDMSQPPEDSDAEDGAGPTFGDLIRTHETVDVSTSMGGAAQHTSDALTTAPPRQIAPAPAPSSLGIVLAQALRSDDADLLESCLQISDATTIRNTIQRLDSSLAGTLLTQLASRLHRRPGRAHNLMTFVQWTLIAHGGALTTQPDIQKRLSELNRVLEERARGLNSLLALKGKLDMLEAQMTLRRGNKTRRGGAKKAGFDSEDEVDDNGEEGIVYVEGEEDEPTRNGLPLRRRDDEDDDFPVVNGVGSDSDEDSDDDDQEDMDVDDLAEESLDEDEVDHDDVEDSGEEDESEVEAAPPSKVQKKAAAAFSKKR